MTTVHNTIVDPAGNPVDEAKIEVRLVVDGVAGDQGYLGSSEETILSRWSYETDSTGYWSVDLVPNDDIDPAGTFYEIIERTPPGLHSVTHQITVPPDAATPVSVWIGTLLI